MVTSFDPVALSAAHDVLPGVPTVLACYRIPDDDWMLPLALADGHRAVSIPAEQVDGDFVRAAHDQGTQVYAFAAPAADAFRFAELGVDVIITSDPARALALLR
jgi:glycerophosphoryl diester phosphodiesterase